MSVSWYPEPDPDYVLTDEEIDAAAAAIDPDAEALLRRPPAPGMTPSGEFRNVRDAEPDSSHPMPSQRCEHVSEKTGRRCRKWAVTGFRECQFHSRFGEATGVLREFVMDYARRDLYRMTPLALDVMEEIMSDEAVSPAVRLKAATETLDRIGVRGGTEVDMSIEATISDPAREIRVRLERLASDAPRLVSGSGSAAIPDTDIADAVLVPDDPPSPAAIRAWARARGMEVPSRGRLPRRVVEEFERS